MAIIPPAKAMPAFPIAMTLKIAFNVIGSSIDSVSVPLLSWFIAPSAIKN